MVFYGPVQQGEGIGFVVVRRGVAEGLHGLDHGVFGGVAFAGGELLDGNNESS